MKKKFIIKIFVLIFVFNIQFLINTAYTLNKVWDLNLVNEYTLENNGITEISGGLGKLRMQITHAGLITNGAGGALLNNPEGIIVEGNYAYIVSAVSDAVEIIYISNPSNPTHVSSIQDGDGGALLNDPRAIVKNGNYLYIAVNLSDAIEVIDVSNPIIPIHVSSISDGGTTYLNGTRGLKIVGNYLYATSYLDDALEIIDISNPLNPTHVGSIRDAGGRLDGAQGIDVVGNYAYVTAERNDSLQIINISNPTNPTFVGQLTNGTNGALLNGAYDLKIKGNYAYIVSRFSNSLVVVDISLASSPSHIISIVDDATMELAGARGIIIEGDYLYIASHTDDGIEVMNISDPINPIHITSITDSGITELNGARSLYKLGNYLYVGGRIDDGIEILNIGSYASSSPNIIPNTALVYSGSIDQITTTYGSGNQGNVTYQISKNNGVTWYYLNGINWLATTAGVSESNTPAEIDSEIQTFNGLAGGTGEFLWKAFLTGNGSEKVEIDEIKIDYTSAGINNIIDFESPGGYIVTNGTWTRQTTTVQEGGFAIESGNKTNNSISCFTIDRDIFTDSTVSFFKQVSSEASYDFLRFYIDNVKIAEWSGTVTWGQESYPIGNGNHTFRWCYEKDYSVSNGSDAAWVDFIEITEVPAPPVEIVVLDFETSGGYTITTTATTPGPDWQRVTIEKYEGLYSLESQNNANNTNSCFSRVQTVSATDTGISFYKKISSESGWDFLIFSIDGIEQNRWSGELTWGKEVYTLAPATYTLNWCYLKDGSVSNGQDKSWIDLVSVTQDPPIITETTAVITPTNDNTPSYSFYTPIAGNILYGGSCTSATSNALIGNNTITFDSLPDGIYTDCTIQVLASPQNTTILNITNFTIDTTGIDITINYPIDLNTIPNTSFDINASYSDAQVGVNTGSILISLKKFNGSIYGTDLSSTYIDFIGANITATGSIHSVSQLGAGQYKIDFSIEDNIGNIGTNSTVIYINQSPLLLSTTINNSGGGVFNYEFTINNTSTNNITDWVVGFQLNGGGITSSNGGAFSNIGNLFEIISNSPSTNTFLPGQTHTISFSGTGNGIVTDLYLKSYLNASPEIPIDYSLSQNGLDVAITTTSIVANEYCRNIALTNNGTENITNWQLEFELNQDLSSTSSGTFSKIGLNHTIDPLGNNNILIGNTENISFCSNGLKADNNWLITLVTLSLGDIIAPTISSTDPIYSETKTSGTFDFIFNYSDNVGGDGTNTASDEIYLYKWNGTSYGSDIASTNMFLSLKTVTTSSAIYPSNNITNGQYKVVFKIFDLNNNFVTTSIIFYVGIPPADTTAPSITYNFPTNGILYPNANLNININYLDSESGINTNSILMNLQKWNGTPYGPDISGIYVTGNTINSSNAIYNISTLGFGRYRIYFYIEDSIGNGNSNSIEFYIDEPELIISTGSLDIGNLNNGVTQFSSGEINITVKTVGAGFNLILNKISSLINGTVEIIDWNTIEGIGYDSSPYSSTINLINNNEVIASQNGNININGNKNTYIYNLKLGVLIGEQQTAGSYIGNISFGLNLSY